MTHTQTGNDQDDLLGQVVDEYFEAAATGETPDISDYVRRYPEIADLLKVAIPAMQAAEDATRLESTSALQTPPAEKQLGDFRILRQLGRGGMGIVYEAEQISMKRRVALKVLPLAGLVDELKIQRFHNEVRAVAALDHPNIVSVYMVGEERGVHYFAMQLIRGRSLAQVITSLRQVRDEGAALTGESVCQIATIGQPEEELAVGNSETPTELAEGSHDAAKPANIETVAQADDSTIPHATRREYFRSVTALGIQAATALQHAHDQGIIHRDIKPANLLLDKSAKLYVTDFGLARMEAEAGVTMSGDLLGTLRYMAPEQALAKRVAVDHRADLYSLAVTLYELLTLQPAYLDEDRQQLLKQIAFEEPIRLRRVDPQIPAELETIVLKAMSKDRDERYFSAQELADDLRRFLDNRPIQAKPPTLPQIVSKWTRRNPAIAWASMVTLALVTIAFGISTVLVTKQWDLAVQASQQTADQLKISTITRLAAESRALQDERPILSVLLAVEAVELSQQTNATVPPMAHEALLNATQGLRSGQPLTGHGSAISALTFSPDWLVTWGEGKAHLWDLTARAPWSSPRVLGADSEKISSCALSEDGHWLVTGGSKLQRWDLTTRNPDLSPLDLAADDVAIACFGLSSDGRWLVAQSEDGTVRLWDLDTANPSASTVLSAQADLFHQVAVSSDGRWVAATKHQDLQDATTLIWDLHAEDKSAFPLLLKGHQDYVARLAISPDSRWLVTGSYDQSARLWKFESISATSSRVVLPPNHGPVQQLLITLDGRWLFTTADNSPRIRRWDLSAADPSLSPFSLRAHKDDVRSLAVSRDGRWLVSGSSDGKARFWDLHGDPPSPALVLRAHDPGVEAVAIHPNSRWVATAGADGTALLWDLNRTDPESSQFVLRGHDDDTFSATAVSSDGRWVATEIKGNAVQLWDMDAKGAATYSLHLPGPKATISALEISPDDRWLVAGSDDGAAHVWDLTSHDIPASPIVLSGKANFTDSSIRLKRRSDLSGRLAISPDSRWLALATKDTTVQLWDLKGKDGFVLAHVFSAHGTPVELIVFSADGRWLATGSQAGNGPTVRLWDLSAEDQPAPPRILSGHSNTVYSLAIDSNSRWLAAIGAGDGSVRFWDLKTEDLGTSPRVVRPDGESVGIWRVAISPDARWLFTSRFDRTAQLWDLSEEAPTPHELRGHNGVQSVAISPDGRWLAAGCRTIAHLWDLTAANPASTARVLRGHQEIIWSVRISADSRWLITDASDATIRRWNLDTQWLLNHAREVAGRELTDEERVHYGVRTSRQAGAEATNRTD